MDLLTLVDLLDKFGCSDLLKYSCESSIFGRSSCFFRFINAICDTLQLVGPTSGDNLVSLTLLTEAGATFCLHTIRYQLYDTNCHFKSHCVNGPKGLL